ncbi:MAG: NAD(P)-dependent oxidoreductase [Rhodospirillales bacterium]|nr:NAD(P)-dependent oxidoreductase [Rhodospirillales bacterium]MBO6788354.1 NAD(P)-dependent oxidoreductase [Rhodospirillales bacterium]
MSALQGRKIGFIGLGLMGKPMARNLARAGADMIVHNRSQAPVEELAAEGMTPGGSPRGVAEAADIVICMLTDTPAVEKVMLDDTDGIIAGITPDTLVIDMSTTKVPATRTIAKAIEDKGGLYVDAPVSGGTIGAEGGTLTIMAGGSKSAFEKARPVLDVLGQKITHVGDVGAGQVAKAANQVIVGLNIGAVAEALTLAKHAGVDPARVKEALGGGFADSRVLEVHGQRMVDDVFTPGARATVQRKDMDQALELAAELGIELPATALSRDLYDKLIAAGGGDLDHAGLIKAIDPD